MRLNHRVFHALLLAGLSCTTVSLYAAQPKFTLTPLTPTTVSDTTDDTVIVQYNVTNQTAIKRTLTMKPILGVSQVITGHNACANPFTLIPKSSCVLTLHIPAGTTPARVEGGPEVCKTKSATNNQPDPLLCSQPSAADVLHITRGTARSGRISISPDSLNLTTGSTTSGQITVTNLSYSATLTNIQADFTGTALANKVTQNSSDCTSVAPRSSCNLIFTPQTTSVSPTTFSIYGSNTHSVSATMAITAPTTATITLNGSPLILATEAPGTSGNLTITNTSTVLTATNISAQIASLPGVTQNASGCTSVLPRQSCTLIITAGSTAIPATNVVVQGSNTSQTLATIAVNSSAPSIAVTAGSPLTLIANGTSTGTMTITNNGTAAATNVTAYFANTSLNGNVTASTCSSIAPSNSCNITYTSTNTKVVPISIFPIYGSNTSTVGGALTLKPVPRMYITSGNSDSGTTSTVSVCDISTTGSTVGNPTNCSNTNISASLLNTPIGIALDASQTHMYTTNNESNSVTQCLINRDTGVLSGCNNFVSSNLLGPAGIAIVSSNVYVANEGANGQIGDTITQCKIDTSGNITTPCTNYTSSSFVQPASIAINTVQNVAYIGNINSGTISTCPLTNLGGIDTNACVNESLPSGTEPAGLALHPSGQWLYASDSNNSDVYACPVGSGGTLGTCFAAYANYPIVFRSIGLTFNSAGTTLYVTNSGTYFPGVGITQLAVDTTTGLLTLVGNFNLGPTSGVALFAD